MNELERSFFEFKLDFNFPKVNNIITIVHFNGHQSNH